MHFGTVLGGIWPHFCLHLAIKIPSKNALEILSIFRSILGGILGALGLPFGSQNRSKNRSRPPLEHREAPGACPGASGPSKVTKNGAQSEPKTLKIDPLDASRLPKRSPRRHEISKNGAFALSDFSFSYFFHAAFASEVVFLPRSTSSNNPGPGKTPCRNRCGL